MKLSKKLLSLFLAVLMTASMMTTIASAHTFTDVTEYSNAIDTLSKIKVILGYNDTTFAPETKVTRWMMALMVAKLHSGNCTSAYWFEEAAGYTFTDVEDYQYKTSIKYCADRRLIIGQDSQTFNPNNEITLQDAITLVVRALGYHTAELDQGYPKSYTTKGEELGLFKGLTGIDFKATLNRGQTAQLLYNALYLNRLENGKEAEPFSAKGFTYVDPATGKTETCYANDVETYVLSGTSDLSIDNVSKPGTAYITFRKLNADGTLGASKVLPVNIFEGGEVSSDFNSRLGRSYRMAFDKDGKLQFVQANSYKDITSGLTINEEKGTVNIGITEYKPVSKHSYNLFDTAAVPANKELIIYGINDVYTDPKSSYYTADKILDVTKIKGTTASYTLNAFDDNGDGYYDRAIYTPYSIDKLIVGANDEISLADGSSDVTVTGVKAKSGDIVLYSYNSQGKILDIKNVVTLAYGTLSDVSDDKKTATIGTAEYKLGNDSLVGAANADVIKSLPDEGCEVAYVIAGDSIVFIQDKNNSTNNIYQSNEYTDVFGNGAGVVTQIFVNKGSAWPCFKYIASVDIIGLSGSTTVLCGVHSIDGVSKALISDDMLEVGDIVQIKKNELKTLEHKTHSDADPFAGSVEVYDLKLLNSKPTLVFNEATVMSYSAENGAMSYVSGAGSAISTVTRSCLGNAAVMLYNGERFGEVKTAAAFADEGAVKIPANYALYVLVTGGTESKDCVLYVRPYIEKQVTASDYDTYVYLSNPRDYEYKADTNGKFSFTFTGIDVYTGVEVPVTLYSGAADFTLPSTAGYYPAAVIGSRYELFATSPITASDENGLVGYRKGAEIVEYLTPADTETEKYGITLKIDGENKILTPKAVKFYKNDAFLGFLPVPNSDNITSESIEGQSADYFYLENDPDVIAIVIK